VKYLIPKELIKRWITYKGRRVPILDKRKVSAYLARTSAELNVKVKPATLQTRDTVHLFAKWMLIFFTPPAAVPSRPTPEQLITILEAMKRVEQKFPGLAKGIEIQFFRPRGTDFLARDFPIQALVLERRFQQRMLDFDPELVQALKEAFGSKEKFLRQFPSKPVVTFNVRVRFVSPAARRNYAVSSRFGYPALIAHEFGHLLSARVPYERFASWKELYSRWYKSASFSDAFSCYALVNFREGFAEAFAGFVFNDKLLRETWPEAWRFFARL